MTEVGGAPIRPVPQDMAAIFASESPAWIRLEPQSVSGDPSPGLEARVHDPLWLLARQLQLGEFLGEDTGSPVSVQVRWTSTPVDMWRAGGQAAGSTSAFAPADLLEPLVESELISEPGLRWRFEAGTQFLSMLADAGQAAVRQAVLQACALSTVDAPADGIEPFDPNADPFDKQAARLVAVFAGSLPDGERIAGDLRRWLASGRPPQWLPVSANEVAQEWLTWHDGSPGPDCWQKRRLDYRFGISAGGFELEAKAFGGGRVDWFEFDSAPSTAATGRPLTHTIGPVPATPLRFAGMPADRYWEFEDGTVNFGALEAKPYDLARLALAEFALVYGQDWMIVPIDVPVGEVTVIDELTYMDTFGHHTTVRRADDAERFRLFEIEGLPGLFVPPATPGVLEGAALEEVLFLRDEMANLVWAVEQTVRGPSGRSRPRIEEPVPAPLPPGTEEAAELDYLLQSVVPGWWIPFVPMSAGAGTVELRKATLREGPQGQPAGRLLEPGRGLTIHDAEVPREGVLVRRVPLLARRPDGRYARWISRRASVGRGETTSRISFDAADLRRRQ